MPFISRNTIDQINNRMDAVAIMKDYVRMEQKGGRFWGLCPFHNEKTPSFTVNPDLKSYYCFGCHKGGSMLDFVMEMDKLTFPEAVEHLAKRTGVEIQYESQGGISVPGKSEDSGRKEALYELYRRMSGTFQHFLSKKPESEQAMLYINKRGINKQMIEQFRLGYAPRDKRWMHSFLAQKGYSVDFLARSGLFSARYPELPLFCGRLMFPINDRQGRVVAFGGRILDESGENKSDPKYINSPEIEIYKKRDTIFAIDLALPEIRKTKTVYLAEGYMDVIALHQAGITNAVAPLGTAFTDEQAKLLRRWAEQVVLFFDSDEAGQKAAVKGILTCRKNGLGCGVVAAADSKNPSDTVNLAGLKDPADILKSHGAEALRKTVENFINDFDYLVIRAKTLYNTRDSGGKASAINSLFPYLQVLESEVSRDACIEAAAAAIGTTRTAIVNDWRRFQGGQTENTESKRQTSENQRQVSGKSEPNRAIRMNDELFMLMTVAVNDFSKCNLSDSVLLYPEFRRNLTIRETDDPFAKEIFVALEECYINNETGLDNFLARISSLELKKFCLEKGASDEFAINPRQIVADGLKKVKQRKLEKQLDEIVLQLKAIKMNSENSGDAERLLADKILIDEKLRKLKEDSQ